ncbi:NAD(+)/NADH kinase, partial [Candidatus Uhrbacteria bacterium]|nr:NAD(+)/NADH kinase [Candidatus Uhrbacteria bacterium]
CVHADTPHAREVTERIHRAWLAVTGTACVRIATHEPIPADTHAIFAVGGDGFLLELVRARPSGIHIPICGWNAGHVGFHMNDVPEHDAGLQHVLHAVARGDVDCETLYPLVATLEGPRMTSASVIAFNEIALTAREPGHVLRLALAIDVHPFGTHSGDGLIVASPQGSTGWAIAVGGPAVHPDVRAMVVAPINPHPAVRFAQMLFPFVAPPTVAIAVDVLESEKRPATVSVDGHRYDGIHRVVVRTEFPQSDARIVQLISPRDPSGRNRFFRRVEEKFLRPTPTT